MLLVVCSVRDRAANVYAQPFFAPTLESSIRSFRMLINDAQGGLPHQHPDDFDLYHLGTYDDETGVFKQPDPPIPVQIALGRDMVKPVAPLARS